MNDANPARLTAQQQIIVITLQKIMHEMRFGRPSEATRLLESFWDHQRAIEIEGIFRQMLSELTRLRSLLPTTADGVSIADCPELYCPHCGDKVLQYPACCVCENCGTDESGTMELEYSETVSKPTPPPPPDGL